MMTDPPAAFGASQQSAAAARTAPRASPIAAGHAEIEFRRAGHKTVLAAAISGSPLRLLAPRNHGEAAWVFLSSLGGGLVDGDRLHIRLEVGRGASALVGTQASTKVYRSPGGCAQRVEARVEDDASLVLLPDPVVCFAGARYRQEVDVSLAPRASLVMLDGYTCGRGARGERWQFSRYASRVRVDRDGERVFVDATRLDPEQGPIAARMGDLDVVLSLMTIGAKFSDLRAAILASRPSPTPAGPALVSASPIGADGAVVRIAAENHEKASRMLRASFAALARALGDDPFARKW